MSTHGEPKAELVPTGEHPGLLRFWLGWKLLKCALLIMRAQVVKQKRSGCLICTMQQNARPSAIGAAARPSMN